MEDMEETPVSFYSIGGKEIEVKENKPSWTMTKKILVFGPASLLVVATIISAVQPKLIMIPTICFFVFCLQVFCWSVSGFFRTYHDDYEGMEYMLSSVLVLIAMYHSHGLASWMSLGVRDLVVSIPHALSVVVLAIWDFIYSFFHHAFCE